MKVPQSTVRLARVVQTCGRPEPVTLWTDPHQDKHFQAAVRQNRVLTVKQETVGAHKDYGVVGFHEEPHTAYWVFPKALHDYADKRVIGIDYGLLSYSKVKDPIRIEPQMPEARAKSASSPIRPNKSKPSIEEEQGEPGEPPRSVVSVAKAPEPPRAPKLFRFAAIVRCQATVDVTREVEATSLAEAKRKALALVKATPVSFADVPQTQKVVKVKKMR